MRSNSPKIWNLNCTYTCLCYNVCFFFLEKSLSWTPWKSTGLSPSLNILNQTHRGAPHTPAPHSASNLCASVSQLSSWSLLACLLFFTGFLSQCTHLPLSPGRSAIQIRGNLPALQTPKKSSLSELNYFPYILQVGSEHPDYDQFHHFEKNFLIKNLP